MEDDSESTAEELLHLPVTQKDAWSYVWKLGMAAAYLWLYSHFISVEQHEKDLDKLDKRVAMLETTLTAIDKNVALVSKQIEDEAKYRKQ